MAKQDMHELGFGKSKGTASQDAGTDEEQKKKTGFVAGLPRKQ